MFSGKDLKVKLVYMGFGGMIAIIGMLFAIGMLSSVTAQNDKFGVIECTEQNKFNFGIKRRNGTLFDSHNPYHDKRRTNRETLMNEHPIKHPPLFTKDEVVKDILENMSITDKARLKHTPKDELVMHSMGWGTYIRNYYQIWHNEALVRSTGVEHPKDASMVIIEEVWAILQQSEETGLEKPPEPPEIHKNVFFKWHVDKECLEISCNGTSIIMYEIGFSFAQAIADAMNANLLQTRTRYVRPDVEPRSTHFTPGVVVTLRKYPKYKDDGEIDRNVRVEWLVNEQRLEITCGGRIIAMESIDLDLAETIAAGMKTGLPQVERYVAFDVAPRITHNSPGAVVELWMYPKHPDNRPKETPQSKNDPLDNGSQDSAIQRVLKRFKKVMGRMGF